MTKQSRLKNREDDASVKDGESADNEGVISSTEEAKEYLMRFSLQRWPKIPRRKFWVTRYDALAEYFVLYRTIFGLSESDCHVVERVFGLELQFENGTARWLGKRVYLLENPHRTNAFRLLTKMWQAHWLLPLSHESADYRNKLAIAIETLEEAFLETMDRVHQVEAQMRGLLNTCPRQLSESERESEWCRSPRHMEPGETVMVANSLPLPWPKGF